VFDYRCDRFFLILFIFLIKLFFLIDFCNWEFSFFLAQHAWIFSLVRLKFNKFKSVISWRFIKSFAAHKSLKKGKATAVEKLWWWFNIFLKFFILSHSILQLVTFHFQEHILQCHHKNLSLLSAKELTGHLIKLT
jgi:hypothetical protein